MYERLGLTATATAQQIRTAFRTLSKIHHPDAGGDEEDFLHISQAARILLSPGREHYDETGEYEREVRTEAEQIRDIIIKLYYETLPQISDDQPIIATIKDRIIRNNAELANNLQKTKRMIAKLERIRDRIHVQSGHDNIFRHATDQQLFCLNKDANEMQLFIDNGLKILDVLDLYLEDEDFTSYMTQPMMRATWTIS